ncbi:MAG: hypothetical protein FWD16_03595 [Clostridia bacterium]|nr:hypothetical protein [Clostridia bacterium]
MKKALINIVATALLVSISFACYAIVSENGEGRAALWARYKPPAIPAIDEATLAWQEAEKQEALRQFENGTFEQPPQYIPEDESELYAKLNTVNEEYIRSREVDREIEAIIAKYLNTKTSVSSEFNRDDIILVVTAFDAGKLTKAEKGVVYEFLYDRVLGLWNDDPLLEDVNRVMGR